MYSQTFHCCIGECIGFWCISSFQYFLFSSTFDIPKYPSSISQFATAILSTYQQNFGKVMISVMSVCHSVHGEFHVTIILHVLDLTVQGPAPLIRPFVTRPQLPLYKSPSALLKISDGQDWIPVQTFSL